MNSIIIGSGFGGIAAALRLRAKKHKVTLIEKQPDLGGRARVFRKNGFNVSNKGYLLYYNGLKNQPMFNQELKFEKFLIPLDCDDSWVEEKIIDAVNTLNSEEMPKGSKSCDTCQYLKKRWEVSQSLSTN